MNTPSDVKFARALHVVLNFEGGYSNNKADPGGATMRGITQRTYDWYRHLKRLAPSSVKTITDAEVSDIYRMMYWDVMHCDEFSYPVALLLFDSCVQWGAHDAVQKILLPVLGLKDGCQMSDVWQAIRSRLDVRLLANEICDRRVALRYQQVKNHPSTKVFLQGWLSRDSQVRSQALQAVVTPSLSKPSESAAPPHSG